MQTGRNRVAHAPVTFHFRKNTSSNVPPQRLLAFGAFGALSVIAFEDVDYRRRSSSARSPFSLKAVSMPIRSVPVAFRKFDIERLLVGVIDQLPLPSGVSVRSRFITAMWAPIQSGGFFVWRNGCWGWRGRGQTKGPAMGGAKETGAACLLGRSLSAQRRERRQASIQSPGPFGPARQ
jgi:hypothetical protein